MAVHPAGRFSFELELTQITPAEVEVAKETTTLVKNTRHLLRHGHLHHLIDPTRGNLAAWSLVAPDTSETVMTAALMLAEVNWHLKWVS